MAYIYLDQGEDSTFFSKEIQHENVVLQLKVTEYFF